MSTYNTSNVNISNNSQYQTSNITPNKSKIKLTKHIMKNDIINNVCSNFYEKSSQTNSNNNSNKYETSNNISKQIENKNKNNSINSNIYLTSVFKLPEIKSRNYNQSFIFPNNKSLIKSYEKNLPLNLENNSNIKSINLNKSHNKIGNLESYMKEKFYQDVEKNTKMKLKKKNWFSESETQDHIIHMKKVVNFWNGLCDYTIPKFSVEKFKQIKNELQNKNNKNNKNVIKIKKEEEKKYPILFTNSIVNNLNHKKKIYNENLFYKEIKNEFEF